MPDVVSCAAESASEAVEYLQGARVTLADNYVVEDCIANAMHCSKEMARQKLWMLQKLTGRFTDLKSETFTDAESAFGQLQLEVADSEEVAEIVAAVQQQCMMASSSTMKKRNRNSEVLDSDRWQRQMKRMTLDNPPCYDEINSEPRNPNESDEDDEDEGSDQGCAGDDGGDAQHQSMRSILATTDAVMDNGLLDGNSVAYIYIIRIVGSDVVKIGWSNDVLPKLRALHDSSAAQVELQFEYRTTVDVASRAHRAAHRWLCNDHVQDDWFNMPLHTNVLELMTKLIASSTR